MNVKNIVNKNNYSCFENIIYNLANIYNCGYRYIFMDSWSFFYNSASDISLDENICDNRDSIESINDHQINLLKSHHGINIEWLFPNNMSEFIYDTVNENTVLVAEIDMQDIRWYKPNQVYDVNHYFIIMYNDELNGLYCLDSLFSASLQKLEIEDIMKIKKIGLVKLCVPNKVYEPDFNQVLKHAANACNNGNGLISDFQMMKVFANDLTDDKKASRIYKPKQIDSFTILRKIHYIYNGRYNFHELLETINCIDYEYKKFILGQLTEIIAKWQLINNFFIKWAYSRKDSILDTIANKLFEASVLEENLTKNILSSTL